MISGNLVENPVKHNWGWDYRRYYIYPNGKIVELKEAYRKSGWVYWMEPKNDYGTPIIKILATHKVDRVLTTQTGKLTYKKKTI